MINLEDLGIFLTAENGVGNNGEECSKENYQERLASIKKEARRIKPTSEGEINITKNGEYGRS